MKFDFVDTMAETVVRAQHRRILVGLESPANRFFGADAPAKLFEQRPRPIGSLAIDGVLEHAIRRKQVVIDQRRRLIQNFVRVRRGAVS